MKKVLEYLPELEGDESEYINQVIEDMPDEKARMFSNVYRSRRKDPVLFLVLSLIGLFGVAGIHRFYAGHIGMGILYLLTCGLCFIGTIVDMINYKNFAFEYNRKVAKDLMREFD